MLRIGYAFMVIVLGACSPSDPGAGSPFNGNSTPGCSTGTVVVLSNPIPGSRVSPRKRVIEIASSAVITKSGVGLAVGVAGGANEIEPLYGPIATPTPSPTPPPAPSFESFGREIWSQHASSGRDEFPNPIYYAARGFSLKPHEDYKVGIASLHSSCRVASIKGASFRTKGAVHSELDRSKKAGAVSP